MASDGTNQYQGTIQRRVSWVDEDGVVYESQWFTDSKSAAEKYEDLCETSGIKRVVMHKKRKIMQWDRERQTEPERPGETP